MDAKQSVTRKGSNLGNLEFRVWAVKMPQVLSKVFDIDKEHVE